MNSLIDVKLSKSNSALDFANVIHDRRTRGKQQTSKATRDNIGDERGQQLLEYKKAGKVDDESGKLFANEARTMMMITRESVVQDLLLHRRPQTRMI